VRSGCGAGNSEKPVPETYSIADLKEHAPTFEDLPASSLHSSALSSRASVSFCGTSPDGATATENRERTGKETSSDAGAADSGSVSTVRN